ncbi:MAG: LON peptidase substrate-binding domain-containing protein, partial [Treponema sp.]|nr:LON peptidase substrate-binding domain-containing protein [Treponema sp.]
MLPLRELVLFPDTVVSIFVKSSSDISAVEEARARENRMFAACIKKDETNILLNEPYEIGTVIRIINRLKLPDNTYRLLIQCEYRGAIVSNHSTNNFSMVRVEPLKITGLNDPLSDDDHALMRSIQKSFAQYADYSRRISSDTLSAVERTESPERLANLVCNAVYLKTDKKIELLKFIDTRQRLHEILEILEHENQIYGIQKNISGKVKSKMDKRHREYILNEQLREINKELGKDKYEDDFLLLENRIKEKNPPQEVTEKAEKEIKRLRKLQAFSPEAGVVRTYLEWIADLPWSNFSVDSGNLSEAEKILDEDHYGMQKAKERIIEFIAVRQLLANNNAPQSLKGPILCFVGPPGTGKTSLGKSVARALGREFVRVSLGG